MGLSIRFVAGVFPCGSRRLLQLKQPFRVSFFKFLLSGQVASNSMTHSCRRFYQQLPASLESFALALTLIPQAPSFPNKWILQCVQPSAKSSSHSKILSSITGLPQFMVLFGFYISGNQVCSSARGLGYWEVWQIQQNFGSSKLCAWNILKLNCIPTAHVIWWL